MAALCTPTREDGTAGLRSHTLPKPVGIFPLPVMGLEGAFH